MVHWRRCRPLHITSTRSTALFPATASSSPIRAIAALSSPSPSLPRQHSSHSPVLSSSQQRSVLLRLAALHRFLSASLSQLSSSLSLSASLSQLSSTLSLSLPLCHSSARLSFSASLSQLSSTLSLCLSLLLLRTCLRRPPVSRSNARNAAQNRFAAIFIPGPGRAGPVHHDRRVPFASTFQLTVQLTSRLPPSRRLGLHVRPLHLARAGPGRPRADVCGSTPRAAPWGFFFRTACSARAGVRRPDRALCVLHRARGAVPPTPWRGFSPAAMATSRR